MTRSSIFKQLLAGIAAFGVCAAAWAQMTIDFSSANGVGTAQDKMLIQNIRVTTPVTTPFGTTTAESTYNVLFTFDPASLHLIPAGITQATGSGANACATVNVQVYNSVLGSGSGSGGAVSGATVLIGTRSATTNSEGVATFTGLPPGATAFTAYASGYVATSQVAALTCPTNTVAMALSPSSGQTGGLTSGQFRVILTWGLNPDDLDSHMTGPNADGSRWHVYYSAPSGGDTCGLDVDDVTSYGPETITCPATGTVAGLRDGVYRYSVHHYSGSGTIGTSGAAVRLEFSNGTVYNYTPPSSGWVTDDDVWTVFELTVNAGTISVAPVNAISHGVSASSVARPKKLLYGQPENRSLFLRNK